MLLAYEKYQWWTRRVLSIAIAEALGHITIADVDIVATTRRQSSAAGFPVTARW